MPLRQYLARLGHSSFVRAVGVLVGGTAFGHAITAATMPIVTRLYSPADFSVLVVFSSVMAIIAVGACLRFDIAVPLPVEDREAANLLALSLSCAAAVCVLLGLIVVAAPGPVANALRQPALEPYLWLLPVGIFLAGAYSALQFWFVRQRQFATLARTRIVQSAAASGVQIAWGLAGVSPFGLLLGHVVNSGAACLGFGRRLAGDDRRVLAAVSLAGMRSAAVKYSHFPKYSTIEALCNSASIQLPVLLIAALAAGSEAGHLMLALYVVQAPIALIGGAVAQVYLARAPEELRSGTLGSFTASVIAGLVRSGVGPLAFAGIVSPLLIAPVFGAEWERAGVLVSWLTPWFAVHFITAPVSMALHVTGQQRMALWLQVAGLVGRVAAVVLAAALPGHHVSEAYALSGLVFYTAYLFVVFRVVRADVREIGHKLRRSLPACAAWIGAGATVAAVVLVIKVLA